MSIVQPSNLAVIQEPVGLWVFENEKSDRSSFSLLKDIELAIEKRYTAFSDTPIYIYII